MLYLNANTEKMSIKNILTMWNELFLAAVDKAKKIENINEYYSNIASVLNLKCIDSY